VPPAKPWGAWCRRRSWTMWRRAAGDQKLFWDVTNWVPACKPYHNAKSAREGGLMRPPPGGGNLCNGSRAKTAPAVTLR
jgi:hypothetical protein